MFSAAEYPFQDTKYCLCPHVLQCEGILSISYSSSPLIRSGGGLEKFGPVDNRVVRKFCHREEVCPLLGMSIAIDTKIGF